MVGELCAYWTELCDVADRVPLRAGDAGREVGRAGPAAAHSLPRERNSLLGVSSSGLHTGWSTAALAISRSQRPLHAHI